MSEKSLDSKSLAKKLAEQELLIASYREIERELRVAKEFSEKARVKFTEIDNQNLLKRIYQIQSKLGGMNV